MTKVRTAVVVCKHLKYHFTKVSVVFVVITARGAEAISLVGDMRESPRLCQRMIQVVSRLLTNYIGKSCA